MLFITGSPKRTSAKFTNLLTGAAYDPDSVVLVVLSPDGTETRYVFGVDAIIVRDAEGAYHADLVFSLPEMWNWRWEGTTGRLVAQAEDFQYVTAPKAA